MKDQFNRVVEDWYLQGLCNGDNTVAWGWEEIDAILQTPFSYAFSWMKESVDFD